MATDGYPIENPEDFLGPDGKIRFFSNENGQRICSYFWPCASPTVKGCIVLLHGNGCHACFEFLRLEKQGHCNLYKGSCVDIMNQHGYSVCSLDFRGCGRSDGLRAYINKFDDYVNDGTQFIKSLQQCSIRGFSNLPTFILGVSMGGCVATQIALSKEVPLHGVVLLAPMLSLEKIARTGMNRILRPVGSLISYFMPTVQVGKTSKNEMFPLIQMAWDADPLCYKGAVRARTAVEYLNTCCKLVSNMRTIDFPFLVYHSENDTMTDPDGSKMLYQNAKSEDKTLRLVNDKWHVLLKEPGWEELTEEVLEWMDKRTGGVPYGGIEALVV